MASPRALLTESPPMSTSKPNPVSEGTIAMYDQHGTEYVVEKLRLSFFVSTLGTVSKGSENFSEPYYEWKGEELSDMNDGSFQVDSTGLKLFLEKPLAAAP